MSTYAFTPIHAFRASSALLRERSNAGCAVASAEIARRGAGSKGGYIRECLRQGVTPKCSGSAPKARRAQPAPATPKRDAIKGVRAEFDARMTRVENTMEDVIAAVSSTHQAVKELSSRVSARMAA